MYDLVWPGEVAAGLLMRLFKLLVTAVAGFAAFPADAQESDSGVANYAYSIFVGTGRYNITDRTIYVVRMPLEFQLSEPDYADYRLGYALMVPLSVGITNFDDFRDLPEFDIDSLQTVSFAPGVEIQVPAAENWLVKPFAQAGLGWDMQSSTHSIIWGAGARTRAWFGENQNLLVGGELLWAGNNPNNEEPDTRFTRLALGAEYKWQTNWEPFGRRVSLHTRVIQWIYGDGLRLEPPIERVNIDNATEIGVSFGISPPINILGYKFRQGGIGYERSDEYNAITLFTTFPF